MSSCSISAVGSPKARLIRFATTRWCGKPISAWMPSRDRSSAMRLEVEDLHVHYGRIHALRGVSLSVGDAEVVAVLDANGAGKSSLLRAIMGLAPVSACRVALDGVGITDWPPHRRVRCNLSLVPEGRRIIMSLTIHENLLMGAFARHDAHTIKPEVDAVYGRFSNLAARRHMAAYVLS